VATSGWPGNRSADVATYRSTRRPATSLRRRDLGSGAEVAWHVRRSRWTAECVDVCDSVRSLRRVGRCAEAPVCRPCALLRRGVQVASEISGCSQPDVEDAAVVGGRPSFVEARDMTCVESSIPEVATSKGSSESMCSFLCGSSAELVHAVGHTLNARRKDMRGRQWWFTPSSASSRIQDRVDRKRSRREYPTNTGARFAGRALWSPSQRDERRRRRW